MDVGDIILGTIGSFLYPLFSIIFFLIQVLQDLFFTFAGVGGDVWYRGQTITSAQTGNENETGLLYHMLTTDLVKNMILSIMLLGVFLLVIFTAMAFIKNSYSSKPKTWQEIVGNTFKGLANFIFIPVCCLLGVWLGNILLQAINSATSNGSSPYMDRKLFICCAYNANKYRNKETITADDQQFIKNLADSKVIIGSKNEHVKYEEERLSDPEYAANLVDQIFSETSVTIYEQFTVGQYYNTWAINYLTLIVGGVFMMYVLVSVTYGMIRRMFILLMLFIISPAMCSMYPLDEGRAVGSWKGDFIKHTISAYGAIAGMNLFFSILPLMDDVNIVFGGWLGLGYAAGFFVNSFVKLILMISGLFVVKEFITMISGYVGAENSYSAGASLRDNVKKKGTDYAKKTISKGAFYAQNKRNAINRAWETMHDPNANWRQKTGSIFNATLSTTEDALRDLTGMDLESAVRQSSNATGVMGALTGFASGLGGDMAFAKARKEGEDASEARRIDVRDKGKAAAAGKYKSNKIRGSFNNLRTRSHTGSDVVDAMIDEEYKDAAFNLIKDEVKAQVDEGSFGVERASFDSLGLSQSSQVSEIENAITIVDNLHSFVNRIAGATDVYAQKGIAGQMRSYIESVDVKGNTTVQSVVDRCLGLSAQIDSSTTAMAAADVTTIANTASLASSAQDIGNLIMGLSDSNVVARATADKKADKK